jgi:hypothetical protein
MLKDQFSIISMLNNEIEKKSIKKETKKPESTFVNL